MNKLVSLLVVLSLIIVPTFAFNSRSIPKTLFQDSDVKIRQVENGLSPLVRVKGEKLWSIEERMKHYKVPGLSIAVVDDYKLQWAKGYGVIEAGSSKPVTSKTAFQAASISKSVNGAGIVRLADQGGIDLDADINELLTSWKFPYDKKFGDYTITIKNLLSHTGGTTTSGFPGYTSAENLPTLEQILGGTGRTNTGAVRSFRPPNQGYRYSGGGTVLTQLILRDVTKKSYEEFIKENVFTPTGMKDSFYEVNDSNKSQVAYAHRRNGKRIANKFNTYPEQAPAGLWTTPSDIARFTISVQEALEGKSDRLMSQKSAEMMLRPYMDGSNSALGFFISKRNGSLYFEHGGSNEGFKCQYYGSFKGGKGVVVMVNSDSFDIIPEVIRSVATTYNWPNFYDATERTIVKLNPDDLRKLEGVYQFENGSRLRVSARDNKLFLGTRYGNKIEMFAESKDIFFLRVANEQIKFKGEKGNESFDLIQNGSPSNAKRQKPSLAYAMLDRLNETNVDTALKWFEASKDDSKWGIDVFDLNEVGYLLFQESRVQEAIKVFRYNIKSYPDSTKAQNRLEENNVNNTGYDYMRNGKIKDAIEIFKLNVDLYPKSSNVYDSLGEAYLNDKQYELALKNYEKSVEINPKNTGGKLAITKIKKLVKGN